MEEFGYGDVVEMEGVDGGFEDEERGDGIEEGVVPGFTGDDGLDLFR